ncbi:MAG: tRNA 2-thiouridine(34) synthase MnmA [Clostridia bacterium]|nr:tRNA 2-thiouridine(34) synthase MnmA [Clostridia bacterium]
MFDKKVMVAMSGGVDSSVAAALLLEKYNYVCGATLRLYECDGKIGQEVERAKSVCDRLSINHYVFDKRDLFEKEVISRFSEEYNIGLTPNPCIECNKYIKFGTLLDEALKMGMDYIATGHYSRIIKDNATGKYAIIRPEDRKKDQTYVLWKLNQHQLSHILMPLGEYTKDSVREIAAEYGFESANAKESQDICFVPDGDYAAFLENHCGICIKEGDYVDINGNYLGKHLGHQHYTVGQRKGLGIALGKPQFVISKDSGLNQVVLSDEEYLFKNRVYISDVNFCSINEPVGAINCTAKLRYSAKDTACRIEMLSEDRAVIEFDAPQRAPSPGQSAVFYDGNMLLGGGIITKEQNL